MDRVEQFVDLLNPDLHRRPAEIPGPAAAAALVAEIGDWNTFSSGRSLAAWIGLAPKQHPANAARRQKVLARAPSARDPERKLRLIQRRSARCRPIVADRQHRLAKCRGRACKAPVEPLFSLAIE
ncbi:transposase [Bradyrhizobium sp. WD16]|uniref:transposase n=1 Tax=Bradyrhizobium sp. WD16 TaxID=1521768 RepID=UPI0035324455